MLAVEERMALRNSEGEKRKERKKKPLTDGLEALSFTFNGIGY